MGYIIHIYIIFYILYIYIFIYIKGLVKYIYTKRLQFAAYGQFALVFPDNRMIIQKLFINCKKKCGF